MCGPSFFFYFFAFQRNLNSDLSAFILAVGETPCISFGCRFTDGSSNHPYASYVNVRSLVACSSLSRSFCDIC